MLPVSNYKSAFPPITQQCPKQAVEIVNWKKLPHQKKYSIRFVRMILVSTGQGNVENCLLYRNILLEIFLQLCVSDTQRMRFADFKKKRNGSKTRLYGSSKQFHHSIRPKLIFALYPPACLFPITLGSPSAQKSDYPNLEMSH